MSKPDSAKSIDTSKMDEKQARAARKAERIKVWKREGTKAKRQQAQAERIAAWEEATGQKWGDER